MKSLSIGLGIIFIGLVIFGCAGKRAADWRLFAETQADIGVSYYDARNITHSSKDIVGTWIKLVYYKDGVALRVKELGKTLRRSELYAKFIGGRLRGQKTTRFAINIVLSGRKRYFI